MTDAATLVDDAGVLLMVAASVLAFARLIGDWRPVDVAETEVITEVATEDGAWETSAAAGVVVAVVVVVVVVVASEEVFKMSSLISKAMRESVRLRNSFSSSAYDRLSS